MALRNEQSSPELDLVHTVDAEGIKALISEWNEVKR